jgi:hypothetical protein
MNLTPSERGEREFKHILKLEILFSLNGRSNSPKIENFDRKRGIGKPEILCFPPFLSPFPYFWVPKVRENKKDVQNPAFSSNFSDFWRITAAV